MKNKITLSPLSKSRPSLIGGSLLLAVLSFSGCDGNWWHNVPGWGGYWWQRGQPKGTEQLLSEANERFTEAVAATKNLPLKDQRTDILGEAEKVNAALTELTDELKSQLPGEESKAKLVSLLQRTEVVMMGLEAKLSIGSRAAYGELNGELRRFIDSLYDGVDSQNADFKSALSLYSSRTKRFLANELSVSAPVS